MNSSVTVKDLARICQVSIGTIDRAINNRPGINPDTKERILATARELGFVKNQNALSLSSGRSNVIGIIIFGLNSEYFTVLATAVEAEARRMGYATVLMMTNCDEETEQAAVRRLLSMNVAGLIVLSVLRDSTVYTDLRKAGIPVIAVGNHITEPGAPVPVPYVGIDDYASMTASCELVISRGYRNLIYVAPLLEKRETQNMSAQISRYIGFTDTMARHPELTSRVISTYEEYRGSFAELKPEDGTALICPSDSYTLRCLSLFGIPDPGRKHFGIMGFDHFPTMAVLLPKLSGISYPTEEIGTQAVRLLFADQPDDVIVPYHVIEGETI